MFYQISQHLFYSLFIVISLFYGTMNASSSSANTGKDIALYKIEGNIVFPPDAKDIHDTQILVNEGEFVGIPRVDGSFVVAG